jgi:hypothetical protein
MGPGVVHPSYQNAAVMPPAMPMPYNNSAPYPSGPTPYPMHDNAAPFAGAPVYFPATGSSPYPPQQSPYPPATSGSAPYPPQQAPYPQQEMMQQPPAYNEVVGSQTYQKQSPYNPNFSG